MPETTDRPSIPIEALSPAVQSKARNWARHHWLVLARITTTGPDHVTGCEVKRVDPARDLAQDFAQGWRLVTERGQPI